MSFSIYQISWIERKSNSLNKRRHLVNALFKFHSVFRGFVEYIIITIQKNGLLPTIKIISTSQISSFFGYLLELSLAAKMSSSKTVAKTRRHIDSRTRDIPSYGSQSKRMKLAFY